jgi:serine/threonine protein kinase
MSPESVKQKGVTAKCDIWSVGCCVVEMATGKRIKSYFAKKM